jgi:hypothetical protein
LINRGNLRRLKTAVGLAAAFAGEDRSVLGKAINFVRSIEPGIPFES